MITDERKKSLFLEIFPTFVSGNKNKEQTIEKQRSFHVTFR
jgi:hypothetical protein